MNWAKDTTEWGRIRNYELGIGKGRRGEGEKGGAPLHPLAPSPLLGRMMALSEAYQEERPNVEAAGMTALVIRALGLIVGKMVRDEGGVSTISTVNTISTVSSRRWFISTMLVTGSAQALIEAFDIDINIDQVTTRSVGRVLTKMRLIHRRLPNGGKRGWMIALEDVTVWAKRYGLNPAEITGLHSSTPGIDGTNGINGTNGTHKRSAADFTQPVLPAPLQGIL